MFWHVLALSAHYDHYLHALLASTPVPEWETSMGPPDLTHLENFILLIHRLHHLQVIFI